MEKIEFFLDSMYGEMLLGVVAGTFSAFCMVSSDASFGATILLIFLGAIGGAGLGYVVWRLSIIIKRQSSRLKNVLIEKSKDS